MSIKYRLQKIGGNAGVLPPGVKRVYYELQCFMSTEIDDLRITICNQHIFKAIIQFYHYQPMSKLAGVHCIKK
jgi:hypothetical protein